MNKTLVEICTVKAMLVIDRNEERIIGKWTRDDPFYKVAKNLAQLCSSVLWRTELVNDEIRYLAEISKQSVEGMAWFLLTVFSKM